MTITIGRASLATAPSNIVHDGDGLRFNLDLNPGSLAEAQVLRQQLTGLVPGEVVPVTFSLDADFDGFYQVSSPVAVSPITTYLSSGFMRSVVSLRRIGGGYGSGNFNLTCAGYSQDTPANPGTVANWVTEPNTYINWSRTTDTGVLYYEEDNREYSAAVGDYYNGAATIEYRKDSIWYPVVGDQLPTARDVDVRVGNGIVRITLEQATPDTFTLETYHDSTWDTVDTFQVEGKAPTPATAHDYTKGARILRNSPESVAVSFRGVAETTTSKESWTAFRLNRGEMLFAVSTSSPQIVKMTTAHNVIEVVHGGTDVGWQANSDTADGHRWVMLHWGSGSGGFGTSGDIEIHSDMPGLVGVYRDAATITDYPSVLDSADPTHVNSLKAIVSQHEVISSIHERIVN